MVRMVRRELERSELGVFIFRGTWRFPMKHGRLELGTEFPKHLPWDLPVGWLQALQDPDLHSSAATVGRQ